MGRFVFGVRNAFCAGFGVFRISLGAINVIARVVAHVSTCLMICLCAFVSVFVG